MSLLYPLPPGYTIYVAEDKTQEIGGEHSMAKPGTVLQLPPRIKVLEALGAIADGRIEKLNKNVYRVVSSERDREYLVYIDVERELAYSNDNGTRFRGYVGYPIIAALMLEGILPFGERVAEALRGIPWRRLNEQYKRYLLAESHVKRVAAEKGVAPREVDELVSRVLAALRRLGLRYTRVPPLEAMGAVPSTRSDDICRIVLALAKLGVASVDYLKAVTGLPRHRIEMILAMLEAYRLVERISDTSEVGLCSRCPLAGLCGVSRRKKIREVKFYRVTTRALKACKRRKGS